MSTLQAVTRPTATIYVHLWNKTPSCPASVTRSATGTRAGVRVCKTCRGELVERQVSYGVVEWRDDGRYAESDVLRFFANENAATRYAESVSATAVVRTF